MLTPRLITRTAKPVSDLVEQLQHAAEHEPYSGLYEDAAAAIVSLRADVARLAAVPDDIAERAKVVSWLALPETWQDAVNCTMAMNNGDAARMAKWYSDRIAALAHLQERKP